MGVPASEVCYTSAMPRREDHEVHKDMWGIGPKKKIYIYNLVLKIYMHFVTQKTVSSL